jgi:hypothetical protein
LLPQPQRLLEGRLGALKLVQLEAGEAGCIIKVDLIYRKITETKMIFGRWL